MNSNFTVFYNVCTKGINIPISQDIFFGWVKKYYIEKGVKFFITKNKKGNFIIFPIENISKYFDISAMYREKKSGSSNINNSNIEDIKKALSNAKITFEISKLDVISKINLDGLRIYSEKYQYLLRKYGEKYKVRKLSNTKNANVIFSIKLKKNIEVTQNKRDLNVFENSI